MCIVDPVSDIPKYNVYFDRATMVNGAVKQGDNVLITGIGGGVALTALQLCVARGANVYVTSGGEDKIRKAVALGAKGGVSYKAGAFSLHTPPLFSADGANRGLAQTARWTAEEERRVRTQRSYRCGRRGHHGQDVRHP